MMLRFLALTWDPADETQAQAANVVRKKVIGSSTKWRCALQERGLWIFSTGDRAGSMEARTLENEAGVIMGALFESIVGSDPLKYQTATLDAHASREILKSRGRALVEHYWGDYVAILRGPGAGWTRILRGPVSSLPCLSATFKGLNLYFSFVNDVRLLNILEFSVNWRYIATSMLGTRALTHDTGLCEVSQVMSGECITISKTGTTTETYWNPLDFAAANMIEDEHQAGISLRNTTKACVHAWASCHDSITHNLSGGLDSSIVLCCLMDAPSKPRITCVTEYTAGADSDEREYARLVVQKTGCLNLIEHRRSSEVQLQEILAAVPLAIPQNTSRRAGVARFEAQTARDCHATAVFSGSAGDAVFFQGPARLSVTDLIHRHGLCRTLFAVAYNAAQLEGISLWRMLGRAFYEEFSPKKFDALRESMGYRRLINAAVIDKLRFSAGYGINFQRLNRRAPLGKITQAFTLIGSHDYYDAMGSDDDPQHIAPLMSQPLLETVLRIPTYTLMVDGWDRGLARRAFSGELPLEISRRRDKGGMEDYLINQVRANIHFCRDLLLNGLLVEKGLLDRTQLAEVLSDQPSSTAHTDADLQIAMSIEAWARSWSDRDAQIAA